MTKSHHKKPLFNVSSKIGLAALVGVPVGGIDYVACRINNFYVREKIAKSNGGTRVLHKPLGPLIRIQAAIKKTILDKVSPLPCVHGCVRRRSIITNASKHVRKELVMALDIKDCFPNIGPKKVMNAFNELGITGEAARVLVRLTTFDFQLPQGTKTSPALANLVLRSIDRRLHALAKQHCCSYTRYVDDITLSGSRRLVKLQGLVHKILATEGFQLKSKNELMFQNEPQVVTKLLVNQKVNVTRDRRDALREEVFRSFGDDQRAVSLSTMGRVRWLESVNPEVGLKLRRRISFQQ